MQADSRRVVVRVCMLELAQRERERGWAGLQTCLSVCLFLAGCKDGLLSRPDRTGRQLVSCSRGGLERETKGFHSSPLLHSKEKKQVDERDG